MAAPPKNVPHSDMVAQPEIPVQPVSSTQVNPVSIGNPSHIQLPKVQRPRKEQVQLQALEHSGDPKPEET